MLKNYRTISIFEPDEIIPLIQDNLKIDGKFTHRRKLKLFNEFFVIIDSLKLRCFKKYGLTCYGCGIEAKNFHLIEKIWQNPLREPTHSLQAFGIDENGKRVLMTVDHIIPVSKGGRNAVVNTQPMCENCNNEKGDKLDVL